MKKTINILQLIKEQKERESRRQTAALAQLTRKAIVPAVV
jgi:hypothetical protein